MNDQKRLKLHKSKKDQADGATKPRPTLHKTSLSLKMGPSVIEGNANGDTDMVAIVNGWEPVFRITLVEQIEDRAWN